MGHDNSTDDTDGLFDLGPTTTRAGGHEETLKNLDLVGGHDNVLNG